MKNDYIVILFYKFIEIKDPEKLKKEQLSLCKDLNLKGRVILGKEGINATLEGLRVDIKKYQEELKKDKKFSDIFFKESESNGLSFPKLSVKVRDEIVTLNAGNFDIEKETAQRVSADELQEWFEKDEDFVVLDLRNKYETNSGQFEKTFDPELENFRDLPQKLEDISHLKNKKVVTVCTGGIRCEKATCLLKKEGFENIFQLDNGIHSYMEKYPNKHFKGTLFVFDNRITTPIVNDPKREIIGSCAFCNTKTENYVNDDDFTPSKKLLCCENCFSEKEGKLRKIVS